MNVVTLLHSYSDTESHEYDTLRTLMGRPGQDGYSLRLKLSQKLVRGKQKVFR